MIEKRMYKNQRILQAFSISIETLSPCVSYLYKLENNNEKKD